MISDIVFAVMDDYVIIGFIVLIHIPVLMPYLFTDEGRRFGALRVDPRSIYEPENRTGSS